MFPVKDYKKIAKKDIEKVFRKSVAAILEAKHFDASDLMEYILRIVVADQRIHPEEVRFACQLSQDVFEMSLEEFSECYANVLRENFQPRYVL